MLPTNKRIHTGLLLIVLCITYGAIGTCMAGSTKQLIETGWDNAHLYLDDIINNPNALQARENSPFDGIQIRLHGMPYAWTYKPWKHFPDKELEKISHSRFTSNYIFLHGTNYVRMQWYNDKQWKTILANLRLVSKAVKLSNSMGILLDPEPYGKVPSVWAYNKKLYPNKSFTQVQKQVERRGVQYITALQSDSPDLVFFGLRMWTVFPRHVFKNTTNADTRKIRLRNSQYALFLSFINGLLKGAGPGVSIVDGNENYSSLTDEDYKRSYQETRQAINNLVPKSLRKKAATQVSTAMAISVAQLTALRTDRFFVSNFLTPEQRAKLIGYETYLAMKYSDKYVWVYTALGANWWTGHLLGSVAQRMIEAHNNFQSSKPIGYSMRSKINKIREIIKKKYDNYLRPRYKVLTPRGWHPAPELDGKLNGEIWSPKRRQLKPFVPIAKQMVLNNGNVPSTYAIMTFDDKALYIAFKCEEPNIDKMKIVGKKHDDPVWKGDDVEVFISRNGKKKPYYHFAVNPKAVKWDSERQSNGVADVSWNGKWSVATHIGKKQWTVEIKIPWKTIGGKPAYGSYLHGNLCRSRKAGKVKQLSSWSPLRTSFIEPSLFGTWRFKK